MKSDKYTRAVRAVLLDWKAREVKKPRAMLPTNKTSSTLRYIRQVACRHAGTLDCASWSKGELARSSGTYPCDTCSAPGVPMGQFLFALFGTNQFEEPLKGERALRKWINSEAPMHADDFRRVLAQAFVRGWFTYSQVCTLWQSALELEATTSALRRLLKQMRTGHAAAPGEDVTRTLTSEIEKVIVLNRDRLSERAKTNIMRSSSFAAIAKEAHLG